MEASNSFGNKSTRNRNSTSCRAARDDKVGIVTTLGLQYESYTEKTRHFRFGIGIGLLLPCHTVIQFQFNSIETNLLSNKVQNTTSWVWLHDSDNHGQDQYEYTHIYICIHSHIHVELLSYIEWNAGWHTSQATREWKWQCYWSISLIFSSVCHSK